MTGTRLEDLRLKPTNLAQCPSTDFQICRHGVSLWKHERALGHVKIIDPALTRRPNSMHPDSYAYDERIRNKQCIMPLVQK